jgi:hypothetical protein
MVKVRKARTEQRAGTVRLEGSNTAAVMQRIHQNRVLAVSCLVCLLLPWQFSNAQCIVGEEKTIVISCATGLLTTPGIIQCPGPVISGWYLKEASLGSMTSGKGEVITIAFDKPISDTERTAISRYLVIQLEKSLTDSDFRTTERLASILRSVAARELPLEGAMTAFATVELIAGAFYCNSGNSTNECPHIFVPPLNIKMICLPKKPLE